MEEILKLIKEIILNIVQRTYQVDRMITFGSRVKGTYRGDSDWDIFNNC